MVKADPKRNYYADLDVRPTATTDDIKRSFRTLARRYHPDRNPGKEVEFVPKFQAIQAAHEILADPEQRAKYDGERRKLGYGATRTPPSANTRPQPFSNSFNSARPPRWANPPAAPPPKHASGNFNFNTPPRPQYTRTGPGPQYNPAPAPGAKYSGPTGASGASRFTNFRPPPAPPTSAKDDAEARLHAWERMGKKGPPPSTESHHWSDGERRGPFARESAYARAAGPQPGLNRSRTTRIPKKGGFDPNEPGDFWEPPASRSSSYNTRPPPPVPEPPVVPTRPEHTTHLHPEDTPHKHHDPQLDGLYGERLSTPYASHGGEKTYFSSAFLSRSSSKRDPNRPRDRYVETDDSPVPSRGGTPRARSASPKGPTRFTPEGPFGSKARAAQSRKANGNTAAATSRGPMFDIYNSGSEADSSASDQDQANAWADVSQRPKATPSRRWARGNSPGKPEERRQQSTSSGNEAHSGTGPSSQATGRPTPQKDGKPMYGNVFFASRFVSPEPSHIASKASAESLRSFSFKQHVSKRQVPVQQVSPSSGFAAAPTEPQSPRNHVTDPHVDLKSGATTIQSLPSVQKTSKQHGEQPSVKSAFDEEPKSWESTSEQWSAVWPFGNKKRRGTTSTIPCWAIPSSVSPSRASGPNAGGNASQKSVSPGKWIIDHECPRSSKTVIPQHSILFPNNEVQNANFHPDYSFNIPDTHEMPHPTQPASDSDLLNTKFTAADWSGKFQGSQTFSPGPTNSRKGSKGRSPIRATQAQKPDPLPTQNPFAVNDQHIPPPPQTAPPLNPTFGQPQAPKVETRAPPPAPEREGSPVKFAAEQWQKTFKEPTFLIPQNQPKQPGRPTSTGAKRTAPARGRSMSKSDEKGGAVPPKAAQPPTVEEQTPATHGDDGDAMDIDQPSTSDQTSSPEANRGPRLVPVTPFRPDWRDNAEKISNHITPNNLTIPPFGHVPTAVPNAVPPPPPPPPPLETRSPTKQPVSQHKSVPSAQGPITPPTLNLGSLKTNLTAQSQTGISDLKDLSGTLPFESRASTRAILSSGPDQSLILPKVPNAPIAPQSRRLTPTQWKSYLSQVSAYMGEWYRFEERMLRHHMGRHAEASKFGTGMPSTNATKLLEAQGEPADGGVGAYLEGLVKDRRVRECWDLASEKHEKCVKEFVTVKERMRVEGFAAA